MVIYILTETDESGFIWKNGLYRKKENAERTLENIVKDYAERGYPLVEKTAQAGDRLFENEFARVRLTFKMTRD